MRTTVESTFLPQAEHQRSLAVEAEGDPLANDQEQTWPTAEELELAAKEQSQVKKRVPKGTSEYQAAWMVSDEEGEDDEEQVSDEEMITKDDEEDEEEEMDELVINPNNYDEKFDHEEDQQTFVPLSSSSYDFSESSSLV